MKHFLEIFLCVALHPIAMVLVWIHVTNRHDLTSGQKIAWDLIGIVWGIGPLLYIWYGGGGLW